MVLALIDAALRGMALALLLLLAWLTRSREADAWPARIRVVFCLTLCVQVASSAPFVEQTMPALWQAPLVALSVGNAVLFWVLVQSLFEDDFRLRPLQVGFWLLALAVGAVHCLDTSAAQSGFRQLETFALRAIPLVATVLAAVAAGADWRADLVAERRTLRGFLLASGAVYTLVMLALRLASPHGLLSALSAGFDVCALLLILTVVTTHVIRHGSLDGTLLPARAGAAPGAPDPSGPVHAAGGTRADERLVATLQRVMVEERAYRLEPLTVASLALRLSVPEYRLRRVINQGLGHRNFNAYVNGLRLDEAVRILSDPGRDAASVTEIALEVGFQSIGPFNRAFKARCGRTPSEFRRQRLADSSNRPVAPPDFTVSARPLPGHPAS